MLPLSLLPGRLIGEHTSLMGMSVAPYELDAPDPD
jgi:hypothetical protein